MVSLASNGDAFLMLVQQRAIYLKHVLQRARR